MTSAHPAAARAPAVSVLVLFAAAIAVFALLAVAFEEEVQTVDARELVARKDAARAFFAADFVFVLVYAALLPLAVRRFGSAAGPATVPRRVTLGVLLLSAAGVVDVVENGLLLSATGSVAEGRVDAAHALAAPKIALFLLGFVAAAAGTWRAFRTVRPPGSASA